MQPIGPKLAEGRDSEIFEHGRGKVLRIARDGRSLVAEAEIMRYVGSHGYPCPDVYDAGEGYLVMDRLEGPTMMEMVGKPPFPLRRSGHLLAELHERLHQIAAPPGIRVAPLPGDRLVHRDLHPHAGSNAGSRLRGSSPSSIALVQKQAAPRNCSWDVICAARPWDGGVGRREHRVDREGAACCVVVELMLVHPVG